MRLSMSLQRLLISLVVLGLVAFAAPAAAHESSNHGTIKVHDDAVVTPPTRNDPHVSCEFYIEGFNMADVSGRLEFYSIPPTSNPPVLVMTANWTGTPEPDGTGTHFLAGPFNLTAGHYLVEAFLDDGRPGNTDHKSKSKVFWVNPCQPGAEVPPCPPDVQVNARADGDIELTWDAVADADEYRIYRSGPDDEGDFQAYASVDGSTTSFVDEDVVQGSTYRYFVTAVVDGVESENCEIVEATAIPFFPGLMVGALAVLGGVGAFAWLRRRG